MENSRPTCMCMWCPHLLGWAHLIHLQLLSSLLSSHQVDLGLLNVLLSLHIQDSGSPQSGCLA